MSDLDNNDMNKVRYTKNKTVKDFCGNLTSHVEVKSKILTKFDPDITFWLVIRHFQSGQKMTSTCDLTPEKSL